MDLDEITSSDDKQQLKHLLIQLEAHSENLMSFLLHASYDSLLQKQLSSSQDALIRLYMIEGFDLASRDLGSFSDPYLVVRCGKKVYSRRDKYQLDEPNPKFYDMFEITAKFPGAPPLEIEAWDYDDLFGDDLIGKTIMDLDDRLYCPEWRTIAQKPIEYRELYHPSASLAQGTVLCWADVEEISSAKAEQATRKWDIAPEPTKDYQLRRAVYDTQNVPLEDLEGTSDVFIKAWIDEDNKKETDTHWRCTGGNASFNYRMLFDFKSPTYTKSESDAYRLKLQVYDRDVFASNDFICQMDLDLRLLVLDCRAAGRQVHLNR